MDAGGVASEKGQTNLEGGGIVSKNLRVSFVNDPANEDAPLNEISIMGGDQSNPSWKEYLRGFKEEFQPHMVLIKQYLEKNGLVGECASEIADKKHFEFNDGEKIGFTWRAWGDLMQAVVGKREGYMKYYSS